MQDTNLIYENEEIKEILSKYVTDKINNTTDYYVEDYLVRTVNELEIEEKEKDYILDFANQICVIIQSSIIGYSDNYHKFETKTLQFNSIISNSLLVEQHINDLILSKDLTLKEKEEENLVNMDITLMNILNLQQENIDLYKNNNFEIRNIDETIRLKITTNEQKINSDLKNLLKKMETIKLDKQSTLKEAYKDKDAIKYISKDRNLKILINQMLEHLIICDLIKEIRNEYIKMFDISINEKASYIELEEKCVNVGCYSYTMERLSRLINLSLENNGKNIIEDKTLKLFNILINLEELTQEKTYKNIIKKYSSKASKDILKKQDKVTKFLYGTKENVEKILEELRWCDFE